MCEDSQQNPLVSIIVPAYNAEATLDRCIDSLEAQTLQQIEIIVVDDGSTDRTLHIAHQRQESSCRRIKVVHKDNGGPSSARNAGLDIAIGEYVAFADADDVVDRTAYEKMYRSAKMHDSDIVTCGRTGKDSRTGGELKTRVPKYDVIKGTLLEAPQIAKRVGPLMCDKLYRRSLIDEYHIRFAGDLAHAEDFLFTSEVRLHVSCVSAVRESLYTYYLNSGSSISSGNSHVMDIPEACRRVIAMYRENGVFERTSNYLLYVFMGYFIRKRMALSRFSLVRWRFTREFLEIFTEYYPGSWVSMLRKRLKRLSKDNGKVVYIKMI